MKKKIIIIVVSIIAISAAIMVVMRPAKIDSENITIETAKAASGTISKVVTATGTLEAITTVDVGTQVSGIVERIYVDFNSYVKKGQLLARIDTTNLSAALEQSQANLDNAKAVLDYRKANYNRLTPLHTKDLISQADYDETVYNLNSAKASYKNALAQHKKNKINLDYALIYSPIDGIVLNRAVEEGQTVAASFSTPTLFSIANDLTQMRVEANVDEADIGQVKKGQRVEFQVDAYPESLFAGEITEVRLEPTVANNVVTYTIIISAPNPDFKLMPGMTAETEIYVIEKKNLLVVPSKALRFTPDMNLLMSYMDGQDKPENNKMPPAPVDNEERSDAKIVWIKSGNSIHPQEVKTGIDDDICIEIKSGLNLGDEVILSMEEKQEIKTKVVATSRNPFMSSPPKH